MGLGNPGSRYTYTRHNLGFLTLDALAEDLGMSFKAEKRFNAEMAKGEYEGETLVLLKPSTFMNLSGHAVIQCMQYYKILRENVLVISDDAAIDFNVMRLKPKGSCGGHLGLRHIEQHLGKEYARLRMGIGYPTHEPLEVYVLNAFSEAEKNELGAFTDEGAQIIKLWLKDGLEAAMKQANEKS